MTEEDAFMAAILAGPRHDTARLMFADWLEERGGPGDAARAEFIRLSLNSPEITYWPFARAADETALPSNAARASELARDHGEEWTVLLRQRLVGSPLRRWLGTNDCRWGYRRGFVTVFEGTQQVLLDAWNDLFRLGPIEEVQVNNLWHFGMVLSLRQFLNQPSLRVLRLRASELRDDDIRHVIRVSDWLCKLDRVELSADNPNQSAAHQLTGWLAADVSLRHVRWQNRPSR